MSATLGGLLKDYRLQKNIPQLEIAFALGWKEASRLSRIEQGIVVKPKREVIDKIMNAMDMKSEERNNLYTVGGYVPSKKEIEEVRKKLDSIMSVFPYPAEAMDFTWRLIHHNQSLYQLYNVNKAKQKWIEEKMPHLFDIVFDPSFVPNTNLNSEQKKSREFFHLRMLSHFRYDQRNRTHEEWYQKLMQRLLGNTLFKEMWKKAQNFSMNADVFSFSTKSFVSRPDNKGYLRFYFFLEPLLKDPRFMIGFHVPADKETFAYFETHSKQ